MNKLALLTLTAILLLLALHCPLRSQTVRSGYITVGPDSLYYETVGSGPVMILIHDGVVHSRIWDEQLLFFSDTYKVVRYDRRRYGNSTAATVAYSDSYDLDSLFSQLNIDKACLVGLSSGGRLAIDFTLEYPEKVTALILSGAVVRGLPYTEHFYARGGHLPDTLKTIDESRLYDVTDDPYEIYCENKSAKEKAIQLVNSFPTKGGHNLHRSPQTVAPAYSRLNEITVPTLIMVGEFDMPDVHAHAGAINAGIANSKRIVVYRAGHLLPLEQPAAFNSEAEKFLSENIDEEGD